MSMRSPETQSIIDTAYAALEKFDPEVRNGEVTLHQNDSMAVKYKKKLRLELYKIECQKFRALCDSVSQKVDITLTEEVKSNVTPIRMQSQKTPRDIIL